MCRLCVEGQIAWPESFSLGTSHIYKVGSKAFRSAGGSPKENARRARSGGCGTHRDTFCTGPVSLMECPV
jgi:hypothetical protein